MECVHTYLLYTVVAFICTYISLYNIIYIIIYIILLETAGCKWKVF